MRKGASFIAVILIGLLIIGAILFLIPFYQQFNDGTLIKRALSMTKDVVHVTPGIDDSDISSEFFSDLHMDKISVKVFVEDFEVIRHEGNSFTLRCRYVKKNIKVPLLGIKLKDVDKYIETKKFGL
ncbi:hypothetical protein J7L48_01955 [bacterium]|nr:hypothetical protein [bacterium]